MSDNDYDVGYKKPPKQTQFKKGQSGNPDGRPKGTKNFKTDLQEELDEKILIKEQGQPRTVSKQRALLKALLARGVNGDSRAAATLFNIMLRVLDVDDGADENDAIISPEEDEVLQAYGERLLRRAMAKRQHGEDTDENKDPEEATQ